MTDPDPRQVLERAIDAWNAGDFDAYLDLYAADVVLHGSRGESVRGVAAVRAMYEGMWAAVDSRLIVEDIFADGARVACRYRVQAADRDTGKGFAVPVITILHFANGRCVERWDLEGRTERGI